MALQAKKVKKHTATPPGFVQRGVYQRKIQGHHSVVTSIFVKRFKRTDLVYA